MNSAFSLFCLKKKERKSFARERFSEIHKHPVLHNEATTSQGQRVHSVCHPARGLRHTWLWTEFNTLEGGNENLKRNIISQNNPGSAEMGRFPAVSHTYHSASGVPGRPFSATPGSDRQGGRLVPPAPSQTTSPASFCGNLAFVCFSSHQVSKPQFFQWFLCHQLPLHPAL